MNIIPESESLRKHINQNGVKPGPKKLEQFRQALTLRGTPPLYTQDGKGMKTTVFVKLFNPAGAGSWFITEWNPETNEAFGYVTGMGNDEWGYIPLEEIAFTPGRINIGIEIDTDFHPLPLNKAKYM